MKPTEVSKVEISVPERLSFQLDDDLFKALVESANRNERTVSGEIRLALRRHLQREDGAAEGASA